MSDAIKVQEQMIEVKVRIIYWIYECLKKIFTSSPFD